MTTPAMILNTFCAKDGFRPELQQPWTAGDYTYACNGKIAVRMAAQELIPANRDAPAIEHIFKRLSPGPFVDIPDLTLPEAKREKCSSCNGRGRNLHPQCDYCACVCDSCRGEGTELVHQLVALEGVRFDAANLRAIWLLPGLKVGPRPGEDLTLSFRFDGGDGLLMMVSGLGYDNCVDLPFAPFAEPAAA